MQNELNELRIPFESLLNRGIQRELVDPGNNNSFLNNTYTQAFTLIKVICETSKRITAAEKEGKSRQDEIHNVIAFTGRRGTGKTSAMLSIADSLSKLLTEKGNRSEISDAFVQLPYINAAVLDEEEDIFLIVLSRMFKELDTFSSNRDRMYKKDFHDRARELKEEMCKIHGHYVNLKGKNDLTSSYYSMENLHAKYNIREEFAELVKNYTDLYKDNKTTHLILCIDDVDMSRQDHMRIMQCIHQYFMIPNVVVMVTLNFPILTASLQQDTFKRLNTTSDKESQNLHLAFEHTHDFLRKIIPSDMRITMPSWRKYDYRNLTPVKVNLGNADNLDALKKKFPHLKDSVLLSKLSKCKNKDYSLIPKALILMLLADRTKVYLDVKGNKYHFMEPDSLRNLYDIFYMLYHMNDIADRQNDTYFRDRKANRKILLDYLYFKLLPEYDFSTEEEKLISNFLAEPIDRRGKRIWDYYFQRLTSEEEEKRIRIVYGPKFYEDEVKRYQIENYSFGELFRILYNASRIGVMDRKLIRFILASFSFSLPQYVENEKWRNSRRNEKYPCSANNYRNLRDVFGYTLIGTWCFDMFNGYQVDAVIYTDKIAALCNNHLEYDGESKKVDIENADFRGFIEELMLLLLMTSKTTREPLNVREDKKFKNINFFRIENSIDPTAFLMNSLRIRERFGNMKFKYKGEDGELISGRDANGNVTCYAVSKLLSKIFEEIGKEISADEFDDLVKGQLEKWETADSPFYDCKNKNYKTLWYFLKQADIAYNVIKRAVSYIIYSSENNLKGKKPITSTPFHTIQKFYEIICKKLAEQDEVYFESDSPDRYAPAFADHPVVKKFYDSLKHLHYDDSMKNGCGIEQGQQIYNVSSSTAQYVLEMIKSKNAMILKYSLPTSILTVHLKPEQLQLLMDIVRCLDNYDLDIYDASEMTVRMIRDENQTAKIEYELEEIETQFIENQIAQEEAENDPSQ